MKYPASFTPDPDGGYVVTFRDIPEAITQGDDDDEAMFMARDVLREAMSIYFDEKRPVPMPSKAQRDERLVDLPISVAAKVLLLNEMLTQKVNASELSRRLGASPQTAARLTDLEHATKIDQIDAALQALGKRLEVSLS
ncbi:antitoxin [Janthinobacterium sp. ROICE36]|uniref:type II toxin-antitoxin system HicB family antitoxin n=1 Tax=Janthinobacterium sp. ROICE36 TaxID=2048670 RepID=UPI000C7F7372|nr:type II toxin-antitoxin system HicB family antitoxin [Janthinobacterium sp. ROICE36]PLY41178.1 antitoxin [Janthinobacterium sp. ROICE36]